MSIRDDMGVITPENTTPPDGPAKPRKPRGFAAMNRELVSEIARKGGRAAHAQGTAHEFTSEEASIAGRKGGRALHAKRGSEYMSQLATGAHKPTGEEGGGQ